ncbi:hypothetical protein C489_03041 [Natrinema versiforme JCM 10478]|uniref:Uncharacterized protein n=1 Tax=Natrinema versiforme JCM 10478 TaxID=1227496 RepID=L9YB41_9EURY|nr:hypothetical protein C489_03041 [Natrinema versiforme JCM 10478]
MAVLSTEVSLRTNLSTKFEFESSASVKCKQRSRIVARWCRASDRIIVADCDAFSTIAEIRTLDCRHAVFILVIDTSAKVEMTIMDDRARNQPEYV